jgi:hypothetical protein
VTAHTQRAHATLAPSAAHRWMNCSGSIRMEAGMPESTSTFASEGTAAHTLAAFCLDNHLPAVSALGDVVDIDTGKISAVAEADGVTRFAVDEEMVDAVQMYIDHVYSLIPTKAYELDVEQRLNMRHIHSEIFGTGDAVVYLPHAAHLHVIDFKYGKGVVVDPDENPQLLLYGAGAARRYHNRPVEHVTLHIVQPRAPHVRGVVRSWTTDVFALMEFEIRLERLALATESADAPLVAGDWCRFCKAAGVCPALRERALQGALLEFSEDISAGQLLAPTTLKPAQLATVLGEAELIGNWLKAVQEHAHREAVAGRPPTGFKLVAKRAVRRWRDEDAVEEALVKAGLTADEVFTEPELKSPAAIEKIITKKRFATLEGELVVKQSSGTNLVPVSDPRAAVTFDAGAEFVSEQ